MLQVTDRAVNVLTEMLEGSPANDEQGLRLAQTGPGQFGLQLDEPREGDQVVRTEERPVLIVEPQIAEALDGATLDVTPDPEANLTIQMPEEPPQDGATA